MDILMLAKTEVQQLLDMDALLDALAEGFKVLSDGKVVAPTRNAVTVPNAGLLIAMPAWQPGSNITVKLVSVFHGNIQLGIPGHQALICLFDPQTGTTLSIMDGTYITAMRTAGAAALSARLLARPEAHVLAILGAGVQGHSHLKIFPRIRNFSEIRIASHSFPDAQKLAATDSRARALESFEDAVHGADVVCLCSTSSEPIISLNWLSPGTHITSVGYMPPGGELGRDVIEHAHLFVETRLAFELPPAGCAELVGLDPNTATELGELLLGRRPGRQSDDEITVYKSMGHAMEDMVAANLVYQRAHEKGLGRVVSL